MKIKSPVKTATVEPVVKRKKMTPEQYHERFVKRGLQKARITRPSDTRISQPVGGKPEHAKRYVDMQTCFPEIGIKLIGH